MTNNPFDLPPLHGPPIGPPPVAESEPIGPMRNTSKLAAATVAAFALVLGVRLCTTYLQYQRTFRWEDVVARRIDVQVAKDADQLYIASSRIGWIMLVLAAGVLAAWARAIILNARTRGVVGLRSAMATMVWFVPLFGISRGIRELSRAMVGVGSSSAKLRRWLYALGVHTIAVLFAAAISVGSGPVTNDASALRRLDELSFLSAALLVTCTAAGVLGAIAILHADRVMSGRTRQGKILSMRVVAAGTWPAPPAPEGA